MKFYIRDQSFHIPKHSIISSKKQTGHFKGFNFIYVDSFPQTLQLVFDRITFQHVVVSLWCFSLSSLFVVQLQKIDMVKFQECFYFLLLSFFFQVTMPRENPQVIPLISRMVSRVNPIFFRVQRQVRNVVRAVITIYSL